MKKKYEFTSKQIMEFLMGFYYALVEEDFIKEIREEDMQDFKTFIGEWISDFTDEIYYMDYDR